MGYREASGLILRRRDMFEDDQEVTILTPKGCLKVRAPHARRSQKTFCGRLEPPNFISTRLYRSKKQSRWIVSSVDIEEVFADVLRERVIRRRVWPLLSLFGDVFPEGEPPGNCLPHLKKGLRYLKEGFEPVALVTNRCLTTAAQRTGIAFEANQCASCGKTNLHEQSDGNFTLSPQIGILCESCGTQKNDRDTVWSMRPTTLDLYRRLSQNTWAEVCAQPVSGNDLDKLEALLYRLFHYHFEISLDTLKVRKSL